MKKYIPSLLALLMCVPATVFASSPIFTYFFQQINQLNAEVDQLNDRVTANEIAISDNQARISNIRSINVYVDGFRRGALMEPRGGNFINAAAIRVLLDSEYLALLSTAGDGLREVRLSYQSTNCTGQPYLAIADMNPVAARQGLVIWNDTPAPDTLYYAQAGTVIENITPVSSTLGGVCSTASGAITDAVKVYVNEPTITGVTQSDFIGEVSIGF